MPLLPYSLRDLEPTISWETMEVHYGGHLLGYVATLNDLVKDTHLEGVPLLELVRVSKGDIYNNAAQVWNHDFFFKGLKPTEQNTTETIPQPLYTLIEKSFGSIGEFLNQLRKGAVEVFGSGWLWVCWNEPQDTLHIVVTSNADTPLRHGEMPILCIDLWEHAYYLDYKNKRVEFVDACFSLFDWDNINKRLESWKLLKHSGMCY